MANPSVIIFGTCSIDPKDIQAKNVLEVGAYDINGSMRTIIKKYNPKMYIGVDIQEGPCVDVLCNAEDLVEKFGENFFDVVLSFEMLEHVRNWKNCISNIKRVCKPGGKIIITTRSFGFPYHAYPWDFWRFEVEDFKKIFSDFEILTNQNDPEIEGVFLCGIKPQDFSENDLSGLSCYSMITNSAAIDVSDEDINIFLKHYKIVSYIKKYLNKGTHLFYLIFRYMLNKKFRNMKSLWR